ncbi:MAG: hypothetical protein ACYC25_10475 [Paludibacter sp.]
MKVNKEYFPKWTDNIKMLQQDIVINILLHSVERYRPERNEPTVKF